jgi:hypothetical protein
MFQAQLTKNVLAELVKYFSIKILRLLVAIQSSSEHVNAIKPH